MTEQDLLDAINQVLDPRLVKTPIPQHVENGLQIQDDAFVARNISGIDLPIRSSPDAGANIVGSLPQGALTAVEGEVLNGAEAEEGHARIWYIVGPEQYIYGRWNYLERQP